MPSTSHNDIAVESSSSSDSEASHVASLLDRMKAPKKSYLSKKRKVLYK